MLIKKYDKEEIELDLAYLKFNLSEVQERVYFTWQELQNALTHKIIKKVDVIKYATFILKDGLLGFDIVLEISILDVDEDVSIYINQLVKLELVQEEEFIKEKWLYVILWFLYNNKNKYLDVFDLVERIYSDFDYPSKMSDFVRFMPISAKDFNYTGSYQTRMLRKWEDYLISEAIRLKISIT
ncbi:MAG: hypothetical protein K0R21_2163 [Anaerocolumna sp.]|jgi:hypothetical protein|nr:hypothetical protein [Anaerocolumna sp.]